VRGADAALARLALDRAHPAIFRATALSLLPSPPTRAVGEAIGGTLLDPEATDTLAATARLAPDEPRYAHTHALALHGQGRVDAALAVLARHPRHRESLIAAATFERDRGRLVEAMRHARAALALDTHDREAAALLADIERRAPR
jgi:hypothetical protein